MIYPPKPRYRIEVRLSEAEYALLKALAKQTGKSMSDYIRECIKSATKPRLRAQTYRELKAMSQNLGQLVQLFRQAQERGEAVNPSLDSLNELVLFLQQLRAEVAGIRSTEAGAAGVQSRYLVELSINL